MCEITKFQLFVIDTVPQIARYCRHRIWPFWVTRPYVQKLKTFPENNIISRLNLIYFFGRTSASLDEITT